MKAKPVAKLNLLFLKAQWQNKNNDASSKREYRKKYLLALREYLENIDRMRDL